MNLVSGNKLAKLIGISSPAVSKAARIGRITSYDADGNPKQFEPGGTNLFDADTAKAELDANSQQGKRRDHKLGGRPRSDGTPAQQNTETPVVVVKAGQAPAKSAPPPEGVVTGTPKNINEADLLEKIYKGLLAKQKYEESAGKVVPIDEVAAVVDLEYSRVRARLLGIASKLAPEVALTDDEGQCRALIEAAVVDALTELTADDVTVEKAAA